MRNYKNGEIPVLTLKEASKLHASSSSKHNKKNEFFRVLNLHLRKMSNFKLGDELSLEYYFISNNEISGQSRSFVNLTIAPNPFANGDIVRYTTASSNTIVQGLANNTNYYIVQTSSTNVKLSATANGTPINITANTTASGASTSGHFLTKTIEE
jgi:hypothetical protein